MGLYNDYSSELDNSTLDQVCEDSEDEIEKSKQEHRRSMILLEQNLMRPCDQSPIAPETLRRHELSSDGVSLERVLLERLLLRKELRLRNMQERMLQQEQQLQQQEQHIQELENRLDEIVTSPGFAAFCLFSGYCQQTLSGTSRSFESARNGLKFTFLLIHQALFYFADLVPPFLTLGLAALVQRLGNLLAQGAENYSNERTERAEIARSGGSRSKHERRRR